MAAKVQNEEGTLPIAERKEEDEDPIKFEEEFQEILKRHRKRSDTVSEVASGSSSHHIKTERRVARDAVNQWVTSEIRKINTPEMQPIAMQETEK